MSQALKTDKLHLRRLVVGPCVISFPQLFVPKQVMQQGEPVYGATFLFDPRRQQHMISKLENACTAAANEGWPNGEWRGRRATGDSNDFWWPIRDGNTKKERNGYAGKIFVSARTKQKPGVVDQNVQPVMQADAIYPGMLVNASIVFFSYKMPKWGIGCALNNVQIVGDGERLGGKPDPADEFEPVDYEVAPKDGPAWMK
jgi:hypothetical protein